MKRLSWWNYRQFLAGYRVGGMLSTFGPEASLVQEGL
jgi:hypothetical protein